MIPLKPPDAGDDKHCCTVKYNSEILVMNNFLCSLKLTTVSYLSLANSFAGGTWDWEYLGFGSPEVRDCWLKYLLCLGNKICIFLLF